MAEKKKKRKRGMVFIPYDYEAAFQKDVRELHEIFVEHLLKNRYKCVYALKEITSGEQFEVEIYPEFKKMDEVPEAGRKRDNSKAQKNLNDKNARKYLIRIINTNFTNDDIWATFTYAEGKEPKDMKEAIRNMQNYIRRINYRRKKKGLPPAKYVYVTEHNPEAEIRWHHHMIMDGLMGMDAVESVWTKGERNQIRRLDKDEFGLTGMANYITKEKDRKKGEKRWNSSEGLKQPRIRKVHSKPPEKAKGTYKPISKYIDKFVRDQGSVEEQMKKWYPNMRYCDSAVYYNNFNGMFYIRARMQIP